MADLISLTFLHLQQLWVINPPKPTAIHVKHRTKSEHHIFFQILYPELPNTFTCFTVANMLQTECSANATSKKQNKTKKSLLRWRQSHWQVRLFSDDCDQSKNYFVAFSYLQKSFFRVHCIPPASDRSRVSPLVFCSPAALITHDKRSLTPRRDRSESNDKHQCVLQSS